MSNHGNRVLSRMGARELTAEELTKVSGSQTTDTVCTFFPNGSTDGDTFLGEC
jgi:hypothetical protein